MSEIVNDLKLSTLEISSSLGLNLSGDSARIKHTGDFGLTIEPHNNPAVPAALVTSHFGHAGTTTDFDVAAAATNAKTSVWYDWRMGNLAQVSALIDISGIVNTTGEDTDVVGYTTGAAAEILRLPEGAKILNISANVTELSSEVADTYSVFAHSASVNEAATAAGTELMNNINANSGSAVGVKTPSIVGSHTSLLRFLFLANDGANTASAGAGARTAGKILLTMVVALQA